MNAIDVQWCTPQENTILSVIIFTCYLKSSGCSHLSSSHNTMSDLLWASTVKAPTTLSGCLLFSVTLRLLFFHAGQGRHLLVLHLVLLLLLYLALSPGPAPPGIVLGPAAATRPGTGLLLCFVSHGCQVAWWVLQIGDRWGQAKDSQQTANSKWYSLQPLAQNTLHVQAMHTCTIL